MSETSAAKAFRWDALPATTSLGGTNKRTAFRSDGSMVTFNWITPTQDRWEPGSHPFDQILVNLKGRRWLEIEGEAVEVPAGTIARVPASALHTAWTIGDEEVMALDIYAPPRPDYLPLVAYQKEYPQPDRASLPDYRPTGKGPFKGRYRKDSTGIVHRWDTLPSAERFPGMMQSGFRGDDCIVMFNRLDPKMPRTEPHSHPFDQVVMIVMGAIILEIEGKTMEMGPGTVARVPSGVPHTGWPIGGEPVLNIDVFAPPRKDYLYLTTYQKEYGG
jgi:mannose-6-phosphate isomerase-like protein (cupin superfamily)